MAELGLQRRPVGNVTHAFWQGGDCIGNGEPQGYQVFCQNDECNPEVAKGMEACFKETGQQKRLSANIVG